MGQCLLEKQVYKYMKISKVGLHGPPTESDEGEHTEAVCTLQTGQSEACTHCNVRTSPYQEASSVMQDKRVFRRLKDCAGKPGADAQGEDEDWSSSEETEADPNPSFFVFPLQHPGDKPP